MDVCASHCCPSCLWPLEPDTKSFDSQPVFCGKKCLTHTHPEVHDGHTSRIRSSFCCCCLWGLFCILRCSLMILLATLSSAKVMLWLVAAQQPNLTVRLSSKVNYNKKQSSTSYLAQRLASLKGGWTCDVYKPRRWRSLLLECVHRGY